MNFAERISVLTTARTFEDTGVSAYNGAGQFLRNPRHLTVAGKIVSVEARHAAIVHDLLEPRGTSFAGPGVIDDFGLDLAHPPAAVLKKVAPYIVPKSVRLVCQNPDFLKSHYEFRRTSRTPRDLDRRAALLQAGKAGLRMLLTSLPFGLAAGCSGVGKLVANDPARAADVLNFALLLERRESEFYTIGLKIAGLVPDSDRAVIEQIGRNETRHVVFLTTGITGIGGKPDTSTTSIIPVEARSRMYSATTAAF